MASSLSSSMAGDGDHGTAQLGMFSDLTAWMSTSVSIIRRKAWKKHGGKYGTLESAMFIFSEDADVEDTASIYRSAAYLEQHLAVFHAAYIDACITAGGTSSVVLAGYVLPPSPIHKLMKQHRSFAWERQHIYPLLTDESNSREKNSKPTHSLKQIPKERKSTSSSRRKSNDKKSASRSAVKRKYPTSLIHDNHSDAEHSTPSVKLKMSSKSDSDSISEDHFEKQPSPNLISTSSAQTDKKTKKITRESMGTQTQVSSAERISRGKQTETKMTGEDADMSFEMMYSETFVSNVNMESNVNERSCSEQVTDMDGTVTDGGKSDDVTPDPQDGYINQEEAGQKMNHKTSCIIS